MPRKDDHFHPEPTRPGGPAPDSATGAMRREPRPPGPDNVPGDAAIERRRGPDPGYSGPERRLARR